MNVAVSRKKVVGIADMAVSDDPNDVLVTYSLGSCLGVVLYDWNKRIGGMLHAMLPASKLEKLSQESIAYNPYKYVDSGLTALFKRVYKLGADKRNLSLNVFGGAQIFDKEDFFNIGKRNYATLRKMIWQQGVLIENEHVGGKVHRTIKLDIQSGVLNLDINKRKVINYNLAE